MARRPPGQLRTELLDAAISLLREHGDPSRVSVDAVVKRVGCTAPAMYYYFATKDDLLVEACRREYEVFAEDMEARLSTTEDPLADIAARGQAYVEWAIENPGQFQFLFLTRIDLPPPGGSDRGADELARVPGLSRLMGDLRRAHAAGLLDIPDLVAATFTFWAVVHGFAALAVANPDIPLELLRASLRQAGEALLLAYRPEGSPS